MSKEKWTRSGIKYRDEYGQKIAEQHQICSIFTTSLREISKIFAPEEIKQVRGATSVMKTHKHTKEIPNGLEIKTSEDTYAYLNFNSNLHGLFRPKEYFNEVVKYGMSDFPIYYLKAEVTAPEVVSSINEIYKTNINCQLIAEFKATKPENDMVETMVRDFDVNKQKLAKEHFKLATLNLTDLIDHDQILNTRKPNYLHYIEYDPNKMRLESRFEITNEIQSRLNQNMKEKYVMLKRFKPTMSGRFELIGISK